MDAWVPPGNSYALMLFRAETMVYSSQLSRLPLPPDTAQKKLRQHSARMKWLHAHWVHSVWMARENVLNRNYSHTSHADLKCLWNRTVCYGAGEWWFLISYATAFSKSHKNVDIWALHAWKLWRIVIFGGPTAPLHTWQWEIRPLQRVHMDYAEKDGEHFLTLVDAYSKWPEYFPMGHNTTTSKTIDILRYRFAAYGLPETMVSDNGPQFASHEFAMFMENNRINHIRVPPYHPTSNGAAERMVQEVKRYLATAKKSTMTLHHKVANWLFIYRTTPHTFTQSTQLNRFWNASFVRDLECYNRLYKSSLKISNSKRPPVLIKCKRNCEILHRVTYS